MRSLFTALALTAITATTALAEPDVRTLAPGQAQPAAGLSDAAWLEGRWVGDGLGGQAEETYSGTAGGAMVGSFRSLRSGWVEFPLVALSRDRLFFAGCTFEQTGPDAMLVHVRIEDRATGKTRVETFTYRRAR